MENTQEFNRFILQFKNRLSYLFSGHLFVNVAKILTDELDIEFLLEKRDALIDGMIFTEDELFQIKIALLEEIKNPSNWRKILPVNTKTPGGDGYLWGVTVNDTNIIGNCHVLSSDPVTCDRMWSEIEKNLFITARGSKFERVENLDIDQLINLGEIRRGVLRRAG